MTNLKGEISNILHFNKISIKNDAYLFCVSTGKNNSEVF